MSKELEKLKLYWNNKLPLSCSQGLKIVSIMEKREKALEIIREKNVDVGVLRVCASVYAYEDTLDLGYQYKTFAREKLTKDEFDLLKEVLL